MDAPPRPELDREIVTRVAEAVARFGVAGDVRVEGDDVVLEGYGPTVRAPLGTLPGDWRLLAPDVRARRCNDVARRLVTDRRAAAAASAPPRRSRPGLLAPLGMLALAVAGVYATWRVLAPQAAPLGPAPVRSGATVSSADQAETARADRARRVCDEARARALRGATLGPTDVEGWVVEIGLLRPGNTADLVRDPGLAAFVDRSPGGAAGRFVWAGAPELSKLEGPGTEVVVADASVPEGARPTWRGVSLVFTGRYAPPYFHPDQRPAFVRVAAALAERLGATYAGLYAHCDGEPTHAAGSWFEGPDPGGATAALLYFMGLFADGAQRLDALLDRDAGDLGRAAALARIAGSTRDLHRDAVAGLLGTWGGMIAGRTEGPSYVTFPFADSNRAERASLGLASRLSLTRAR